MLSMAPDRIVRRPSCQARTRNTSGHRYGGHIASVARFAFGAFHWALQLRLSLMEIVPSPAAAVGRSREVY